MSALTQVEIACLSARHYAANLVKRRAFTELDEALQRVLWADRQMLRLAIGRASGARMVCVRLEQDPDSPEWTVGAPRRGDA